MKTDKLDIVYFLKPGVVSEEFRYSLRTLKNFPHRNIWVYGNKPGWAKNLNFVPHDQIGTKWENTSTMLTSVVENPEISDNFVVFNDDFFVLCPITELLPCYEGNLDARVERTLVSRFMFEKPHYSRYGNLLKETSEWLKQNGYSSLNYELHIPIAYNKKKMKKSLEAFPNGGFAARRSLYGNMWKIGGQDIQDCKIYSYTGFPRKGIREFVSTTNRSFDMGSVGNYIRHKFGEKSEYEN